jgi:hypothetical protein
VGYGDNARLDWLENHLKEAVGDSGKAVLLFQHYGWDSFSKEDRWWTENERRRLYKVLCRKPQWGSDISCDNPYNVIGIFTGHNHTTKNEPIEVNYGGHAFYNYVSGGGGNDGDSPGSFLLVHLTHEHMEVTKYNVPVPKPLNHTKEAGPPPTLSCSSRDLI